MTDGLLPCPFCGGEAFLTKYVSSNKEPDYYVECGTDGCPMCLGGLVYPTEDEAIKAWNRREL